MADESDDALTLNQVPQSSSTIPGSSQSELAIDRQLDILDEVRVASESLVGTSEFLSRVDDIPDQQGLISGGSDEAAILIADGGDPSVVAFEDSVAFSTHVGYD